MWRLLCLLFAPVVISVVYVYPSSPSFDVDRLEWNQAANTLPAYLAFCSNVEDVVTSVTGAVASNHSITVRSGRHNYAALSVGNGSAVIDVSALNSIDIDEGKGIVTLGAGARMAPIYMALAQLGYAFPGATCPDVSVGGLVLGGGQGLLSRMFGLTADSVVQMQIVLPTGELAIVSADEHPELFWGLRGGGGGEFGVVTELTLTLQPAVNVLTPNISHFEVIFNNSDAPTVFSAWQLFLTQGMPLNMTSMLKLVNVGSNFTLLGVYFGPSSKIAAILDPILSVAPALSSSYVDDSLANTCAWFLGCGTPANCIEVAKEVPLPSNAHCLKQASSYATSTVSPDMITLALSHLALPHPGAAFVYLLGVYGGKVQEFSSSDTPFFARDAVMWMEIESFWDCTNGSQAVSAVEWQRAAYGDLRKQLSNTCYRNHPDLDLGADWMEAYFGSDNSNRLRVLKTLYDPSNSFRNEQSIPVLTKPL